MIETNVAIYLDGLGTVQAFNTVTIRTRVDGQLLKLGFQEGQDVQPGDLLAEIDPAPYLAQLDQNQAKKKQDEAVLANARIQLQRDQDLLNAKILARSDYDTQQYLVDQLAATVDADQAAIESSKVQLDYTSIRSPIEGRTGIRLMDVGNIVHSGDANGLVVLTQLRPISVLFTLPEQTLPRIHARMTSGELTVLAVDRDNQTVLDRGKLAVVDNQITTGTIKLKANFPNTKLALWPGQFVNARLLLDSRTNGIVVPAPVVQRGPDGTYAFVIEPLKTASTNPPSAAGHGGRDVKQVRMQPIAVAQIQDGQALIDSGLSPDEWVVVDGQYRLQAHSRVTLGDPESKLGKAARNSGKPGAAAP